MSGSTWNEVWIRAQSELEELVSREATVLSEVENQSRQIARDSVLSLYLLYMSVEQQLSQCQDHVLHPQKRHMISRTLDCVIGRLLELKSELTLLDSSEFHYLDHRLSEFRLTADNLEFTIPAHIRLQRRQTLAQLRKTVARRSVPVTVVETTAIEEPREGPLQAPDPIHIPEIVSDFSREMAVRALQRHERARQCRVRVQHLADHLLKSKRSRIRERCLDESTLERAALTIQTVWRGYCCRKLANKMRYEELVFLDMIPANDRQRSDHDTRHQQEEQEQKERWMLQCRLQEEYEKDSQRIQIDLRRQEFQTCSEELLSKLRQWIHSEWENTGRFPVLPSEEQGGSNNILKIYSSDRNDSPSLDEKKVKMKSKKVKETSRVTQEKKRPMRIEEEEEEKYAMQPSRFVSVLVSLVEEYNEIWKSRDLDDVTDQRHDVQLIISEKRQQLMEEVRREVDAKIRHELELLREASERDHGHRTRKRKKKRKKKGRVRGGPEHGKTKKKRKVKDLTAERSLQSLIEELAAAGILKVARHRRMDEFIGCVSLIGSAMPEEKRHFSTLQLGDFRRIITERCILPLVSSFVHEQLPSCPRSVLLAGPNGCGKSLLVDAVCTETGAVLLDLSTESLAGLYPGKGGLSMLMHLVNKVARALQPAIIFIDNAERMFARKVMRTDKSEPRRLKKELPRLIKAISDHDRLMIIGTTSSPWDADQKLLGSVYQHVLMVPAPDRSSRLQLLSKQLPAGCNNEQLVSVLATVTAGFTAGSCLQLIKQIITDQRLANLPQRPLRLAEFVSVLSTLEPVMRDQIEAFDTWFTKTPLARRLHSRFWDHQQETNHKSSTKQKKTF